jgi:hypothetical protein
MVFASLNSNLRKRASYWICFITWCCLLTNVAAHADPIVIPTKYYKSEVLRLMIAEANRIAVQLNLDEKLPITETNLAMIFLIPAGKTYGYVGVIDTQNYSYSMDIKDSGVVCSGIAHKGYDDYLEAQKKYVWPISRYDTNHIFQMAVEWMTKSGMDVQALNRDCTVKIDWLGERDLFGRHFFPDYMVSWHQKTNTFHVKEHEVVAGVEFIEPLNRPRRLWLSGLFPDSKHNLRKPLETVDFFKLLTPENSPEVVGYVVEMATNYVRRMEFLNSGNAEESLLREVWADYTDKSFPTNVLFHTNAFEVYVRKMTGKTNLFAPTNFPPTQK